MKPRAKEKGTLGVRKFLFSLALFSWLSGLGFAAQPLAKPFNVLWITGESLQARHLHCYGYHKETSPHIDALAKRGVLFHLCVSPSGWTSESMISNLLGVYSPVHGVITRDRAVAAEWHTPMEMLREAGYILPRMTDYQAKAAHRHLGYTEDEANHLPPWDWIARHKDEPFFMWYHLYESHLPYDAPEPHHSLFWSDDLLTTRDSTWRVQLVREKNVLPRSSITFNPDEDAEAVRALYDAEVHFIDAKFGRIMKALDECGLRERTLVIFSADHAEGLLEHGVIGHASTLRGGNLYDETILVPLILSFPGVLPENVAIKSKVRGVDVMPTIFELLQWPQLEYFQGETLMPLIQDPARGLDRIAFSASSYKGYLEDDPQNVQNLLRVVRTPEWKLDYRMLGGEEEYFLYHLKDDPGETRDVKRRNPRTFRKMKKRLSDWLDQCKATEIRREQ